MLQGQFRMVSQNPRLNSPGAAWGHLNWWWPGVSSGTGWGFFYIATTSRPALANARSDRSAAFLGRLSFLALPRGWLSSCSAHSIFGVPLPAAPASRPPRGSSTPQLRRAAPACPPDDTVSSARASLRLARALRAFDSGSNTTAGGRTAWRRLWEPSPIRLGR